MRYRTPCFKLTLAQFFHDVGLCSHMFLTLQETWRHGWRQIYVETIDRVDPSPRTCAISGLSEFLEGRHVAAWEHHIFIGCTMLIGRLRSIANSEITGHRVDASGASDLHRMGDANEVRGGVGSVGFSSRFRSRSHRDRDPNRKAHLRTHGALWGVRSLDLHRTAGKTRGRKYTIEPLSRGDRAAIVAPSSRNPRHDHQTMFIWESRLRLAHDRGAIVARSWRDRGAIMTPIEAESCPIHSQFGIHDIVNGNHSHDPCNPPPRVHQSAMMFGRNFPLKIDVFLSCSSTFDRFVKKLSEFWERS